MSENQNSLNSLADQLVAQTQELMETVKTEDDLKIGFEKLLAPIIENLGLKFKPAYGQTNIISKRPDAVHGGVIIEYEPPGSFSSKSKVKEALSQLTEDYLPAENDRENSKPVGVGFDGANIFFVKNKNNNWVLED